MVALLKQLSLPIQEPYTAPSSILGAPCRIMQASTQEAKPMIQQLDTKDRAFVLLSLLTLILVGILLALLIIVGARWVRRQARWRRESSYFGGSAGTGDLDNIKKQSIPSHTMAGDSLRTSETMIDTGIEDTQQSER